MNTKSMARVKGASYNSHNILPDTANQQRSPISGVFFFISPCSNNPLFDLVLIERLQGGLRRIF